MLINGMTAHQMKICLVLRKTLRNNILLIMTVKSITFTECLQKIKTFHKAKHRVSDSRIINTAGILLPSLYIKYKLLTIPNI